MTDGIAVLLGVTSEYTLFHEDHMIRVIKNNNDYMDVSVATFNSLYHRLDSSTAALKEDCIRYAIYDRSREFTDYPDWFINAYDNGCIFEEEGYEDFILYNQFGDIVFSPGGIILCNFRNEVTYMEFEEFSEYYETAGGL